MKDKNLIDGKIKTSIKYIKTQERNNIDDDRLEKNKQSIMQNLNSNNHTLSKKAVTYIFRYLPAVAVMLLVFFLSVLLFFNSSTNEIKFTINEFEDVLTLEDFVIDDSRYSADNRNNFMNSIYEMMEKAFSNKKEEEIFLTSTDDNVEDLLFGYWVFNGENIEEEEDDSYLNFIMNDYDSSFSFSIETN